MTKIMLVEDDKSLREIYGVRLLAEGYEITSAGDGEEALAMAVKERPDLILSDVMMPKISGFDMLDILRATPETKDIKIIMMTALSSEDQRARGESLGANRYLVKSQVGIEDVVRTVHEVLADTTVPAAQAEDTFGAPVSTVTTTTESPVTPVVPIADESPVTEETPVVPETPVAEEAPATPAPAPVESVPEVMTTPVAPAPVPEASVATTVPSAQEILAATPTPIAPEAPVAPPVQSIPISSAPAEPTPVVQTGLPQPTAPFSTAAPSSLINNAIENASQPAATTVVEPLANTPVTPDMATRISQELNDGSNTTPIPITDQPIQ